MMTCFFLLPPLRPVSRYQGIVIEAVGAWTQHVSRLTLLDSRT